MNILATTQLSRPTDYIDLGIGQPDASLLPVSLLDTAAIDALSLAYGAPAGDGRFLMAMAAWLSEQCAQEVAADSLLITNGSSNAIDMVCTRLSRAGDTVLVEQPTYFIALKQFADHGLTIVPVEMDEQGLNPQALEAAIEAHKPAFIYTIPSFHNPTGITQSTTRRRSLVALARQYQCPLIADEVYPLLDYQQAPRLPLAMLDASAPVVSIGSFSKILAPGLRLGWIQANPALHDLLVGSGLLVSGGGLSPVTSALVLPLLTTGAMTEHLDHLRRELQERRDALVDALAQHCGDLLSFNTPQGGYFLWAHAKSVADTEALLPQARKAGVSYLPGAACFTHDTPSNAMRLCFAFYDEDELQIAAQRLATVLAG